MERLTLRTHPFAEGSKYCPPGSFFAIDPRVISTPTSWCCGKALADLLLERYIAQALSKINPPAAASSPLSSSALSSPGA